MKIFISYSFRPENDWVEKYVIPLVESFGHDTVTGRILDAGPLDEDVKTKIRGCRRVLCFVTRAKPRYGPAGGAIESWEPPDWVRDELMLARGAGRYAIEFREKDVNYGGAADFRAHVDFDRSDIPQLLVDLAERLKEWPLGPFQFRLVVPDALRAHLDQAANAGTLMATCSVYDEDGAVQHQEQLGVRIRNEQLIVAFWVKPSPSQTIEIEVAYGAQRLVSKGISPAVRDARLTVA